MYYLIFGLLWLVSLLPFWMLYGISNFFYFIVYYILGYRKQVVLSNLAIAFPHKSKAEHVKIAKQFYLNLTDTFVESIKFITISKKQLLKRSNANVDLLEKYLAQGKNIHIMAGHQFNWEFANLLFSMKLSKPFVGVYMPISSKSLDKIFFNFRKRYGTVLISATNFKNKMHNVFNSQYLLALAADQNPGGPQFAYWTNFFGRPTPFVTGPAKGAVRNNTTVVMVGFTKIRRGYYNFTSTLIAENGVDYTPQQLTVLYKNELEKIIKADPANYLWSHRRFKYTWDENCTPVIG